MIRKITAATALTFALALPAYADPCADGIKAMHKAAAQASVKPELRAQVGALLEDAVAAQKKGDGKSCTVKIAQAQQLLKTAKN